MFIWFVFYEKRVLLSKRPSYKIYIPNKQELTFEHWCDCDGGRTAAGMTPWASWIPGQEAAGAGGGLGLAWVLGWEEAPRQTPADDLAHLGGA